MPKLFGRKAHDQDNPKLTHQFREVRDDGLAVFAGGGGSLSPLWAPPVGVIVAEHYVRESACALPGCGKPSDDPIHWAAEPD